MERMIGWCMSLRCKTRAACAGRMTVKLATFAILVFIAMSRVTPSSSFTHC